ncbi:MAG: cell division protein FtsQ/DivIB [Candidatus Glassbacteria bacterium]|nr:cell division protein FtsQ/DivIB [Candidatus Glassbacteria bacterium]
MSIVLPPETTARNRKAGSNRRKRGRSNLRTLILLLLVTVVSCYAADRLKLYRYFVIKKVTMEQTTFISPAHLDSLCSSILLGASTLSSLSAQRKIIESEPLVKSVRFLRRFPDRLTVQVREREPVALLNVGELLPIDSEGFVLPIDLAVSRLDLPILTPRSAALSLGTEAGAQPRLNRDGRLLLEALLSLKQNSPELLPLVSEFTLNEQGKVTLVTVEDGMRVVLGKWVEPDKLRYLKWMLEQVSGVEEKPALVDLSFEGQIILKKSDEI